MGSAVARHRFCPCPFATLDLLRTVLSPNEVSS
jgi:hypothetical protein